MSNQMEPQTEICTSLPFLHPVLVQLQLHACYVHTFTAAKTTFEALVLINSVNYSTFVFIEISLMKIIFRLK